MSRISSLNAFFRKPRESGLSFVLALQVALMFVLAPLASTGVLPPLVVDICRLAMAAAAVMLLARNRWGSIAISVTFIVSIAMAISLRSGTAATIVELEHFAALTAFDVAIAWAVAKVAFGAGNLCILHRDSDDQAFKWLHYLLEGLARAGQTPFSSARSATALGSEDLSNSARADNYFFRISASNFAHSLPTETHFSCVKNDSFSEISFFIISQPSCIYADWSAPGLIADAFSMNALAISSAL